ncbi:MAG: aromatic ring-hydroxylating oxygenase subunit alpha [Gammaproteobacteria bacterium]
MQHATQVRILEDLIDMVEHHRTADTGMQLVNPATAYTDPALFEREWQTFFREHPQIVGLSGDLPEPHDFMALDDFGVPLLATRDGDGAFRAFVNACRHRGTRLNDAPRGCARRFTCPFHGWTYTSDGRLAGVTEREHFGDVDPERHGLIELPAVERHGLLFVHPQPQGLIDTDALLGGLAEEIDGWQVGDRVHRGGCTLDKRMNWKLANDTFGETYHFARLHRNTLNQLFVGDALACEAFGRNHRAVFPNRSIVSLKSKPRERWRIDHASTVLYYLFPNVQITMSERQVTLFRIYPHPREVGRSITHMSHYFSREALAMIEDAAKTVIDDSNVYDRNARDGNAIVSPEAAMEIMNSTVDKEDFAMAESTQSTVESGSLPHLVFGRNEAPLQHFHQTFRAALDLPPLEQA